jgi:hypothetical protein
MINTTKWPITSRKLSVKRSETRQNQTDLLPQFLHEIFLTTHKGEKTLVILLVIPAKKWGRQLWILRSFWPFFIVNLFAQQKSFAVSSCSEFIGGFHWAFFVLKSCCKFSLPHDYSSNTVDLECKLRVSRQRQSSLTMCVDRTEILPRKCAMRDSTFRAKAFVISVVLIATVLFFLDIVHQRAVQFYLLHDDFSLQYYIPAIAT